MKFSFFALLFFTVALRLHAQQKRIYIANDDIPTTYGLPMKTSIDRHL
jgi:hypothetical protein